LQCVDVVITDYSTINYKAVYFDRPLVYYLPDHEQYTEKDKGVGKEFWDDIAGNIAHNPSELVKALDECFEDDYMKKWKDKYSEIKNTIFDGRIADYEDITKSLLDCIETKWYIKSDNK
jgi:CDP-glycerol glycerophosphotransferase